MPGHGQYRHLAGRMPVFFDACDAGQYGQREQIQRGVCREGDGLEVPGAAL